MGLVPATDFYVVEDSPPNMAGDSRQVPAVEMEEVCPRDISSGKDPNKN